MGTEELHLSIAMMGDPLHKGVRVAILVMVIAQAGAQAGDNLQATGGSATPPLRPPVVLPDDFKKFVNGPTSPSVAEGLQESRQTVAKPFIPIGTAKKTEDLETKGGRMTEQPSASLWSVIEHSYDIDDDSELAGHRMGSISGYPGWGVKEWAGEATREGQRPPSVTHGVPDGVEKQQISGTTGDQGGDERPDSHLSTPGETKPPPVPGVEPADSEELGLWRYREGEWRVVHLPDPDYPSLPPPPPPPATTLIVVTKEKAEVERSLEGLPNVTIYYSFYLSDSHQTGTLPELKVYHVKGGFRTLLLEETERGAWHSRTVQVAQADNSSIVFEGWLKADGNIIALRNVTTERVTLGRDEALDADSNQMTLTSSTTESVTSTPEAEGNWKPNSLSEESVSPATDREGQDDATAGIANATHEETSDPSANTSQSPAEGEVEEGSGTEIPTEQSEFEASTGSPDNETRTSEQINRSMDVFTLNSSISGGDTMTSGGDALGNINSSVTTTGEEDIETDEEESATATVIDDESGASENGAVDVLGTGENGGQSSTLSLPGVTTDSLQTNTSVILPTKTSDPLINTKASGNPKTPSGASTETRLTNGQKVSTNVFGGDEDTSRTFGAPQSNATPRNVTRGTVLDGGITAESTSSPAGNSTGGVVAVPVSSTSWQVFQVFLVLCVMGLLALGFLYWKRKRRQDDEIPVFTRHTDYHNPTFTMEDAANFMSRGGRNAYKTIE